MALAAAERLGAGETRGEQFAGTAARFEQARDRFEAAREVFRSKGTDTDYQVWRDQRDWTEEKLPSQMPNSTMRCPRGVRFDSRRAEETMLHVPHITAAQRRPLN
jgi:hypothetical protein